MMEDLQEALDAFDALGTGKQSQDKVSQPLLKRVKMNAEGQEN